MTTALGMAFFIQAIRCAYRLNLAGYWTCYALSVLFVGVVP